jgi:hypothetical protein
MSHEETESLLTLAHDAGEADALWYHAIGDRMTDAARTQFIREQGAGGFVAAMSHGGFVKSMAAVTGDLALAWQQGFESTLAWLDGRGGAS